MATQMVREWVGIQQFPAATQNKLFELLGKLKQENVDSLTILVLGKGDMGKSSTVNSVIGERAVAVSAFQCPQQPESYECGYYVMKWMYDITVRYASSEDDIEKCVSGSQMTTEQMNEVRELWSLYCGNNV